MKRLSRACIALRAVLTVLTAAALAVPVAAQCEQEWLAGPDHAIPGVSSWVLTAVVWDPDGPGPEPDHLVVGGNFAAAGDTAAWSIAAWDGQSWRPLGPGMSTPFLASYLGTVNALAVFEGDLIAAGEFVTAGGVFAGNIARWDGESWQPMDSGFDAPVNALLVHEGMLIAGGEFNASGATPVNHVAHWDGFSWQPLGAGRSDAIHTLGVFNGELFAAGESRIARWDGFGWNNLGIAANGRFSALAVYDGALIVGGSFDGIGTIPARNLARWDGVNWGEFAGGVEGDGFLDPVGALLIHQGDLFVAGELAQAGTTPVNNVARWDGAQWHALGAGVGSMASTLASFQGELVVGGLISEVEGGEWAKGVARWDGATWRALGDGTGLDYSAGAMVVYQGDLILGGSFTRAGQIEANCIVRWNPEEGWSPLGSGIDSTIAWLRSVGALAVFEGDLIAGGNFTHAGGIEASNVARWDGTTWSPLGAGLSAGINGLVVHDGHLIAAAARGVYRWDGQSWEQMGSGMNDGVFDVGAHAGDLYAVGAFTEADGASAIHIVRWNGTSWEALPVQLDPGPFFTFASEITTWNDELVVAGAFASAGGVPARYIARWNGSRWAAFGDGLEEGDGARTLAVYRGDLFVGGDFTRAGARSARYIARWDGSEWRPLDRGLDAGAGVLVPYDGQLIVGGGFNSAGPFAAAGWARWGVACRADLDCDGQAAIGDLLSYLNLWFADDPGAEWTADDPPQIDVFDLLSYLEEWFDGC